jgi:hypothetical protein
MLVFSKSNLIGSGLVIILLGTGLFSLQTPARYDLFPYASYLQLALQVGIFALLAPLLRIKTRAANFWFMMGLSSLLILALASSFWSSYPDLVFKRSLLILGTSLLICVLTLADPKPMETFNRLAQGLVLFVTVMSLIGLIVYFFGRIEPMDVDFKSTLDVGFFSISQRLFGFAPFLRISSLFGNPNTLAEWILVSLTMTAYLGSKGSNRTVWGMLAFIQGTALIFTLSRAGILATIIGLILFWSSSSGDRYPRKLMSIVLGFTGAVALVLFAIFSPYKLGTRLSLNLNFRQFAWEALWTSILNNPILGVGFGVTSEAILDVAKVDSAHSAFLGITSEIGLPGLLLFILVWLIPMWHIRKRLLFAPPLLRQTLSACLAISIAMIFHQMFEFQILRYSFFNLLWTYLLALMVHPALMISDTDVK